MDANEWTHEFVRCAVDILRPSKIPLSPAMAQGILESDGGRSGVLFGIKARKCDVAAGLAVEKDTKEFIGGVWKNVKAYFFIGRSMEDQFRQYLDLCRRVHPNFGKYYPSLGEDYIKYILRPDKAYATDPKYKEEILNTVRSLKLYIFDVFEMYQ